MELATAIGALVDKFGAVAAGYVLLLAVIGILFKINREDAKTAREAIETNYRDRLSESKKNTEDVLTGLNASTNSMADLVKVVTERNVILNAQNSLIAQLVGDKPWLQDRINRLENVTTGVKEDTTEIRRDVSDIKGGRLR